MFRIPVNCFTFVFHPGLVELDLHCNCIGVRPLLQLHWDKTFIAIANAITLTCPLIDTGADQN